MRTTSPTSSRMRRRQGPEPRVSGSRCRSRPRRRNPPGGGPGTGPPLVESGPALPQHLLRREWPGQRSRQHVHAEQRGHGVAHLLGLVAALPGVVGREGLEDACLADGQSVGVEFGAVRMPSDSVARDLPGDGERRLPVRADASVPGVAAAAVVRHDLERGLSAREHVLHRDPGPERRSGPVHGQCDLGLVGTALLRLAQVEDVVGGSGDRRSLVLVEPRDQDRAATGLRDAVRLGVQSPDLGDVVPGPRSVLPGQSLLQGRLVDLPECLDRGHLLQDDHVERTPVPVRGTQSLDRVSERFQDQGGTRVTAQLLQLRVDIVLVGPVHQPVDELLDLLQGFAPGTVAGH
ncbi:hypothetical protein BX285_5379 [Streptomyces sp. 1114.5]|nr:hypothetical protein BX285_5379 [Streptomyces sp. 1114.5]